MARTLSVEEAERLLRTAKEPITFYNNYTKDFVDWALKHNTHNRAIKPDYLKQLIEKMRRGDWRSIHEGIAFTKGGWLADGQHRLLACANTGYPELCLPVTFGLDDNVQIHIDNQITRTASDTLSLATGLKIHNSKAAVVTWIRKMEARAYVSQKVSREELVETFYKFEKSLDKIWCVRKGGRHFSACFFAPLVYLHYMGGDEDLILTFRDQCMSGTNLTLNSPALVWREKILEAQHRISNYEMIASTVTALRAFMEGRPLKIIKVFGIGASEQTQYFRKYVDWLDELAKKYLEKNSHDN